MAQTGGLKCSTGEREKPAVRNERKENNLRNVNKTGGLKRLQGEGKIIRALLPVMTAAARNVGLSPEDVDDAVQDAAIEVIQAVRQGAQHEASVWVALAYTIATRRAIDGLRAAAHRSVPEDAEAPAKPPPKI